MSTKSDEDLHRRAVELVRAAYDVADRMRSVDLAAVNRPRPPRLRYQAQHELVREFVSRAGAMLDFAGQFGLINSDEDAEIRKAVGRDHPELDDMLLSESQAGQSEP
jgi:hypothetical protein